MKTGQVEVRLDGKSKSISLKLMNGCGRMMSLKSPFSRVNSEGRLGCHASPHIICIQCNGEV